MFRLLAILALLLSSCMAQEAAPGIPLGTFPATATFGLGSVQSQHWAIAPVPIYTTGNIHFTWTGITGAPSGCTLNLAFSSTQVQSGATILSITTASNFAITPGTTAAVRVVPGLATSFMSFTTVLPQYACTTYPTTGSVTLEFVPDTQPLFTYSHITTLTSTVLRSTGGAVEPSIAELHTIVINQAGTGVTLSVFDNTTCTGTAIAILTGLVTGQSFGPYDVLTNSGLCILTAGTTAGDYTVTYR